MPTPKHNPGDGSDVASWKNPDGSVAARFDAYGRRRASTTTKPVATAAAGAGTAPTIANAGTDECGTLTVTAGSSPAIGAQATIAFASPYATAPVAVVVSGNDAATATLGPFASATTTTLTIGVKTAPTGAAVYKYNYIVVGGA